MKNAPRQIRQLSSPGLLSILLLLCSVSVQAQTPIIRFDSLLGGLTEPVDIVNAGDGSNRLFIAEKAGKIKIFSGGIIQPVPFLDLTGSGIISTFGGERGLLSLVFHPDYEH